MWIRVGLKVVPSAVTVQPRGSRMHLVAFLVNQDRRLMHTTCWNRFPLQLQVLMLMAPAATRSEDRTTSHSWLDIQSASAAPGGFNPGCHCRLLRDEPVSGLPHVSLQRTPAF